jgi:uncharacterized protein (TIGR03089 family)
MSTPAAPRTFPEAVTAQLRRDATRPLVTFYDDASGERIELSVTTYANWVAKTAGLAADELDAERGGLLLLDVPTHWLGAVWLGAAWSLGLAVTDDPGAASEADLVVCGPEGVAAFAVHASRVPVVGLSLRPLGGRFTEPLPTGVVDYGAVVLAQPDAFVPHDPPDADDVAWRGEDGTSTQSELLDEAARAGVVEQGGRLLTDVNPATRAGAVSLLAPLVHGAGVIWVRHPDEAGWPARREQERATAELRATG